MSKKYAIVKKYWEATDSSHWSLYRVKMAVVKKWITPEEFYEITGEVYSED